MEGSPCPVDATDNLVNGASVSDVLVGITTATVSGLWDTLIAGSGSDA
jgi:hypothetical protein